MVITSELVTNALSHGLVGWPHPPASPPPIWMGLLCQGTTVLCAVFDPGTSVPIAKEPDYAAESGRGLHLIESLSDAWGWVRIDRPGKIVWAVVSTAIPPQLA